MSEEKVVSLGEKKKHLTDEKHSHNEDNKKNDLVYCSFCGRPNTEVIKMIQQQIEILSTTRELVNGNITQKKLVI